MAYWLMKSEPDVFSIEHLHKKKVSGWDGVRNYQARNFMKAMQVGDQAFFYHSNAAPPGIAGLMEVCRLAYPDPTQFDAKDSHYEPRATPAAPVWFQVDVKWKETFSRLLSLDELRGIPAIQDMALFKRSRLSVQPVTAEQWKVILKAARR